MVCKEGLPSHKLYDEKLGKEIDLKDFRRGISFKVFDFSVTYKLARKHFETSVALLKAFTLSEYASEYIEDFDKVTEVQVSKSEISDLSSINSAESIPLNDASPSNLMSLILRK
ncbi:Mitochondrial protein from FMP27 family protein [Candida albicans]|uniref:Mitochondrial protein from FMP27 family protein n=1 Tax=Candida albicans TaxID=5476 RepID=A0A8H6C546_CANAX|nr:Mitochondrial protein from FMP27 family protein [Candida albicans]